jgi:hypothetical protein
MPEVDNFNHKVLLREAKHQQRRSGINHQRAGISGDAMGQGTKFGTRQSRMENISKFILSM